MRILPDEWRGEFPRAAVAQDVWGTGVGWILQRILSLRPSMILLQIDPPSIAIPEFKGQTPWPVDVHAIENAGAKAASR
jgi:hypothetical protein